LFQGADTGEKGGRNRKRPRCPIQQAIVKRPGETGKWCREKGGVDCNLQNAPYHVLGLRRNRENVSRFQIEGKRGKLSLAEMGNIDRPRHSKLVPRARNKAIHLNNFLDGRVLGEDQVDP